MAEERRRRRWVLPVLVVAGTAAVVVGRRRTRRAPDPWMPQPSAGTVPPARPAPVSPAPPAPATPARPAGEGPATEEPATEKPADGERTEKPAAGGATAAIRPLATVAPRPTPAVKVARPTGAEPYGPGSAAPRPDGSAPAPEFTIKGNGQSRVFHAPDSPYYARTRAETWFRTAADAEAAGFRAYRPRRKA